jgi:hypothetical protein
VRAPAEALEVPERVVAYEHHVATATPVATIRAALRDVRLTAEAQAAVATGARLDVDARAILH